MPSAFKARAGKPSFAEMRADLAPLRKPPAQTMEDIFAKYYARCQGQQPPLKEIDVPMQRNVNWKALIMSLPNSKEVLGCGIRKIKLKETECVYQGVYRFHVFRLDNSEAAFDFREAYDGPYDSYKDKSFKDDVETALRAAVLSNLIQYKEMLSKDSQMELVSAISGVALPWEHAVVQHYPATFAGLVDDFCNENQIKLDQIKLESCQDHAYRIKDKELLQKWQIFHGSQASFRVISTSEAMEQDHV